jgi:hypothetical protein
MKSHERGQRRKPYHWYWDFLWHAHPPAIGVYGNSYQNVLATFPADDAGFRAADKLLDDLRSGRTREKVVLNDSLKAMMRIS